MRLLFIVAGVLLAASTPLVSQVVPSAQNGGTPQFFIGGGISDINPDDAHGRLLGAALWADYSLSPLEAVTGLGVEFEARDTGLERPASTPIIREDVASVGPTLSFFRHPDFRPYVKVLFGWGDLDYRGGDDRPYHQARSVTSFGGGFDFRMPKAKRLWIRADYEYQYFPNFWINGNYPDLWVPGTPKSEQSIDPQGFTVGVLYEFSHRHPAN